jgi:hypothetical protein
LISCCDWEGRGSDEERSCDHLEVPEKAVRPIEVCD